MTRKHKRAFLVLLAVVAAGCVKSYGRWPTLEFHHLPYVSEKGERWPHRYICLDKVSETYKMHRPLRVSYIELNPGGKRTVVFIHGLGSYLKFWRYQVDHFAAQGFRVVALDMVGFGKSDKPASFPYTMEAMADVVRELCQKLKVERPVLVGHSMGGHTALSFAIRYPDELSALVLTSPAGFERFSKKEQLWFEKVFTTSLVEDAGEYSIWGSVRYNNFARWRKDLEWLVEERVRLRNARDFESYAYANVKSVHGLAKNDFVRDNLHRVKVPTLIIFGKMDRLIPNQFMHGGFTRWVMRHGKANIRDARMIGLARCGHSVQLDCVDEYNAEVLAFIGK
jgi:pimeloyl-ACP methyl ester carboxylesterase